MLVHVLLTILNGIMWVIPIAPHLRNPLAFGSLENHLWLEGRARAPTILGNYYDEDLTFENIGQHLMSVDR